MNRNTRIAVLLSALCAVLLLLLLAFFLPQNISKQESPAEPPTVIEFVFPYQNSQWAACIEDVVASFENSYPDIDVQYEILYEDGVYEDILGKKAARDELGDIIQLKEPYVWAESGLIAPLPAEYADALKSVCALDGQVYAVCALGSTTGIVYNRAIFRELNLQVPESYMDFLDICARIRAAGITPLGVGGEDLWHLEYWLNHFLRADVLSYEPDFLELCSRGERDWNDPLIKNMLSHMKELFTLGYVDRDWKQTPDGALPFRMAEGSLAMVFSGPWLASSTLSLDPSVELGWFYVPNLDGDTVAGESLDVFWAITTDCAENEEKYAAALCFLEYFYSEGVYEKLCRDMGSFSTLSDSGREAAPEGILAVVREEKLAADIHISDYVGDENTPQGFEKKLLLLLYDMCAGSLSVEDAQVLACRYWDECMEQEAGYED